MKKKLLIAALAFVSVTACTQQDFEESYANPAKVANSSVEKQFAGFLVTNLDYVMPSYWNYFVVLRTTVNRYTQAVGWVNSGNQYVPGAGLIANRWDNYYSLLAQYREIEKIYGGLPKDDQNARRIFMIASTIYLYDHTQKVIDLHGDIPFSEAGKISANGGNYQASLPKYDKADALYTKMLDDLKGFSDELKTINVQAAILTGFKSQDIVNAGDISKWRMYCNSLRLRMLTRVSMVPAFQTRATTEIQAMLNDQSSYPVIMDNSQNIQINVFNVGTNLNSKGFRSGLEDWNGNLAGKVMIDNMNSNTDPRLRVMFEPGEKASGAYKGIDPLMVAGDQQTLVDGGTISIYNRSTLSRNQYFPGVLINAAEVQLLIAEHHLKSGNSTAAKDAYNKAIELSVKQYYKFRSVSNDNTSGTVTPASDAEILAYQTKPGVDWDNAATTDARMKLIATQKWIHYSVVQPLEGWAELRRMDVLNFDFEVDKTNPQKQPPYRWLYAGSELTYNTANYSAVKASDNLSTRIFWDIK